VGGGAYGVQAQVRVAYACEEGGGGGGLHAGGIGTQQMSSVSVYVHSRACMCAHVSDGARAMLMLHTCHV